LRPSASELINFIDGLVFNNKELFEEKVDK